MPPRRASRPGWLAALALLLAGLGAGHSAAAAAPDQVGLFTSLPILWAETGDLPALLAAEAPPHWARETLAGQGAIVPLDQLAATGPAAPLAGLTRLVMAQPRPLSPAENVALDRWVRGGGRLLLLADPALTQPSAYALGDPRRPQDLVLLSPILARWGLTLTFDSAAPPGDRRVRAGRLDLPVDLPGQLVRRAGSSCRLSGGGVLARCRIGRGRVTVLADAALLDPRDGDDSRRAAFAGLLEQAFSTP